MTDEIRPYCSCNVVSPCFVWEKLEVRPRTACQLCASSPLLRVTDRDILKRLVPREWNATISCVFLCSCTHGLELSFEILNHGVLVAACIVRACKGPAWLTNSFGHDIRKWQGYVRSWTRISRILYIVSLPAESIGFYKSSSVTRSPCSRFLGFFLVATLNFCHICSGKVDRLPTKAIQGQTKPQESAIGCTVALSLSKYKLSANSNGRYGQN